MGTREIEQLLEKYYDGTSTEEEERLLESFFAGNDVPAGQSDDQDYFMSLNALKAVAGKPDRLEQRLEAMLDAAGSRAGTATPPVAVMGKAPARRARIASMVRTVAGMAASIAIVASLGVYLHTRHAGTAVAEQATYAQAQAAIVKFSSTLNKGFAQMEMAHEKAKDVSRQINQCIEIN